MLKRIHQDVTKRRDRDKFVIILLKGILLGAVRFYQLFISPLKQPSCRFYPTCSSYSIQAFERYGVLRGMYLTVRRLLKCHPFHKGGYDPLK